MRAFAAVFSSTPTSSTPQQPQYPSSVAPCRPPLSFSPAHPTLSAFRVSFSRLGIRLWCLLFAFGKVHARVKSVAERDRGCFLALGSPSRSPLLQPNVTSP